MQWLMNSGKDSYKHLLLVSCQENMYLEQTENGIASRQSISRRGLKDAIETYGRSSMCELLSTLSANWTSLHIDVGSQP